MKAPAGTRHIFIEFMARDGFERAHAAYEYDNHLSLNNGRVRVLSCYLFVRRIGAPFTLDRAGRAAVHRTLENAINHASVPAPWPFPPPTGPVPWTPQQIAQHQLQQLANTPAAPF